MRVTYGFSRSGCNGFSDLVNVYLASLPDKLYVGVGTNDIQAGGQCLVDGAGSQLPPRMRIVFFSGFNPKYFTASACRMECPSRFWRTGLPVMIIFSVREEFFHTFVRPRKSCMPSVPAACW